MKTALKDFGRLVANSPSESFDKTYFDNFQNLNDEIFRLEGSKIDLKARPDSDERIGDFLRFSALTYDLTTVSLTGGKEVAVQWLTSEGAKKVFGTDELRITVSEEKAAALYSDAGELQVVPGFIRRNDDVAKKLLDDVLPLMQTGRLLIRPKRCLISLKKTHDDGHREFMVHDVDETNPFDLWQVESKTQIEPSIPLLTSNEALKSEATLFTITVPFLTGVSFSDLAKILEDENLHISKMRGALRSSITEASSNGGQTKQIVSDVLQPELDKLSRKFASNANSHAWKVAGVTVSMASLALVAAFNEGWPAALAAASGASGFGLLAAEKAAQLEKLSEIKEHPLYLLWRCREVRQS